MNSIDAACVIPAGTTADTSRPDTRSEPGLTTFSHLSPVPCQRPSRRRCTAPGVGIFGGIGHFRAAGHPPGRFGRPTLPVSRLAAGASDVRDGPLGIACAAIRAGTLGQKWLTSRTTGSGRSEPLAVRPGDEGFGPHHLRVFFLDVSGGPAVSWAGRTWPRPPAGPRWASSATSCPAFLKSSWGPPQPGSAMTTAANRGINTSSSRMRSGSLMGVVSRDRWRRNRRGVGKGRLGRPSDAGRGPGEPGSRGKAADRPGNPRRTGSVPGHAPPGARRPSSCPTR